jgi:catalase
MPEADAEKVPYHPFDLTKVWPKADYPLIEVGEWELNRNAENYHAEVEQAAFSPANLVPGIGVSPDRMLQGRLFSYGDAQRYRLGVNHHQIPVNAPQGAMHTANSYHRDGAMRIHSEPTPGIEPNSYGRWQEQPEFREPPLRIDTTADRFNFREDDDDYFSQPRALFNSFSEPQKQRLFENTARAITGASEETIERHINNCTAADPAYGAGVRDAIEALNRGEAPKAGTEDLESGPEDDRDLL